MRRALGVSPCSGLLVGGAEEDNLYHWPRRRRCLTGEKRGPGAAEPIQANADDLPFEDKCFDAAL